MMAWRERFDFAVVTDPEALAREPGYYRALASLRQDRPPEDGGSASGPKKPKRKLFILEDAAGLILQDGPDTPGDKLGRLLNLTDGLFGQGREDMFLLTFNEPIARIDPAFIRPGRCASLVEFEPFPAPEASAWLRSRELRDAEVGEPLALAELYERFRNPEAPQAPKRRERAKVGFGG